MNRKSSATREHRPEESLPLKPAKRRGRRAAIIILTVVVLGLAGAAAYLVPQAWDKLNPSQGATNPSQAVELYLRALSEGDATTALLYSALQPENPRFASNQFLQASQRENPLTDITVPAGQPTTSPAEIRARYRLGEEVVDAHFTVQKHGRYWLLDGGFLRLNLTPLIEEGAPLTLDGVDLGSQALLELLPGIYTLDSSDPMLTVSEPAIVVTYPESRPSFAERLILSEDAITRIQAAAATHLTACVSRQELNPAGCGFGFAGTQVGEVDPETIVWTLTNSPDNVSAAQPTLDPGSLTTATAAVAVSVAFTAHSLDELHLYNDTSAFSQILADFTDPDQIVITFR